MASGNAGSRGALTLNCFGGLREGFGLKDATPYNVLFVDCAGLLMCFSGTPPAERRHLEGRRLKPALLLKQAAAHRYFGLAPADAFAGKRDGLEPGDLYQWAGFWNRLTPPLLSLVTLPKWMGSKATAESYHPRAAASPEQAQFILHHLLRSCERQLKSVAPRPNGQSVWTGYLDHKSLYSAEQLEAKERFVREALDLAGPRTVLDVGANEGRFSLLAAQRGASVVAVDSDPCGIVFGAGHRQSPYVLPAGGSDAPTPQAGEIRSAIRFCSGRMDTSIWS